MKRIGRQGKYGATAGWYDANLKQVSPQDTTRKYYFRSRLELLYARLLLTLLRANYVKEWEHQGTQWDFETAANKHFRAHSLYTPDFHVISERDGEYWVECKGYNYPGSLTKLRRAAKYYPERKLLVYQGGWKPTLYVKHYIDQQDARRKDRRRWKKITG